jgi:hypothetical protein
MSYKSCDALAAIIPVMKSFPDRNACGGHHLTHNSSLIVYNSCDALAATIPVMKSFPDRNACGGHHLTYNSSLITHNSNARFLPQNPFIGHQPVRFIEL